ncbi:MAG TPA: hypothetical protein VIL92_14530 [Gaiellaceae bacterium]|jgi:hypothetical protein
MWVRIARFEGAQSVDEPVEEVRERMKAGMAQADGPPIKRALMLVDRENGRGANVMFCETEDDLRKVDEFMNSMTPHDRGGTRIGVEMYEVAVDSDSL